MQDDCSVLEMAFEDRCPITELAVFLQPNRPGQLLGMPLSACLDEQFLATHLPMLVLPVLWQLL